MVSKDEYKKFSKMLDGAIKKYKSNVKKEKNIRKRIEKIHKVLKDAKLYGKIFKSDKHYYLDIEGKNYNIFRVFNNFKDLEKYVYSIVEKRKVK